MELEEMLFKKALAMVKINAECGENRSHEWFEAYLKLIKDAGLKDKYHAYAHEAYVREQREKEEQNA